MYNTGVKADSNSKDVLDRWIVSRLNQTNKEITQNMKNYNTIKVCSTIKDFVEDLSTWYLRRSRKRVGPAAENTKDKNNFYNTLWTVLVTYSKALAPLTPFIAEEIYKNSF